MRKLAILALFLLTLPVLQAQDAAYDLTIYHTSSVVDAHLPSSDNIGGTARVATLLNASTATNRLLVDAGERAVNPSHFARNAEIMNILGYDAMVPGNHEFNGGNQGLADFLSLLDFPMVAANVDFSASPVLAGTIPPYVILEVGGEQIGIIGITDENTPTLSSPGTDLIFLEDEIAVTQNAVNELEAQGVNKIVVLAHLTSNASVVLASGVSGVDVIVGGSDNLVLSNSAADADYPYPIVAESLRGEAALIVQTISNNRYFGQLQVSFDANGVLTAWSGDAILLDESIAEDAEMVSTLEALVAAAATEAQVIGTTEIFLQGGDPCREEECLLGNLITDAMRQSTGAQIAFFNSGGIRADIEAGDITDEDVLTVLPFANKISTMELLGVDVIAALEHGVSLGGDANISGSGRFLQVSGLRYTWNPTRPVGNRIVSAEVLNFAGEYEPLDINAIYSVAANNFIRNGGDEFSMLAENAIDPFDFGALIDEVLNVYVRANSPLIPDLEGRIVRQE